MSRSSRRHQPSRLGHQREWSRVVSSHVESLGERVRHGNDARERGAPPRSCQPDTSCRASPTRIGWRREPLPTQAAGRRPRRRRQPAAGRPCGRRRGQRHVAPLPRRPGLRADAGDEGQPGCLAGLARRHRRGPGALRGGRHPAGADRDEPGRDRELLRGLLQRHAVAAVPRPGRQAVVPPGVVGRLRARQPAVRRAGGRGGREGRHGVGAGLPAPAGAADAARPAARPAGSASTCTSRSRPRSCSSSCRGAGRSSRACSAPTWSASSSPAAPRTSSGWSGSASATRPTATRCSCPTAGW